MKEILMSHSFVNVYRIALGLLVIFGSVFCSLGVKAQETRSQLETADKFAGKNKKSPNILFVVMDDVGVDQMKLYGYGASPEPAQTPAIDALAAKHDSADWPTDGRRDSLS